jgi:hypothetical protein
MLTVAGRCLAMLATRVGKHPCLGVGEVFDVLEHEAIAGAAKAVEAVFDVGGIAGLGHLTIIDDVDAGGDLLARDISHRFSDLGFQGDLIERDAVLAGEHDLHQLFGARQTANVGGQKTLVAGHSRLLGRGFYCLQMINGLRSAPGISWRPQDR